MTIRWACATLLAGLLAGCGQKHIPVNADSGQRIYMARCALCHGGNREGRAGLYPPLAGTDWVDGPPERLCAIILDGMQGPLGDYNAVMPGWGAVLQDAEIAAVMTWLRNADGKPPVAPVEVHHVRLLTAQRNTFWSSGDLRSLRIQ